MNPPSQLTSSAVAPRTLRRWCSPETILVVTNLRDSETVLFHGTNQARHASAKIILANLAGPSYLVSSKPWDSRTAKPRPSIGIVRAALDRMAQRFRWIGLQCEPIVLWGPPLEEISFATKAWRADRVIVTTQGDLHLGNGDPPTVAEQIVPGVDIPICVIGRSVPPPPNLSIPVRRVTVALSLETEDELLLRFACNFVREHQADLTVMHVFGAKSPIREWSQRTPIEIASRLPAWVGQTTEPLCPLAIKVREGDPAREIIKHAANTNQDFLILGSSGSATESCPGKESISRTVINEAPCPVLLVRQSGVESNNSHEPPVPFS
jgi:hypothetical protein